MNPFSRSKRRIVTSFGGGGGQLAPLCVRESSKRKGGHSVKVHRQVKNAKSHDPKYRVPCSNAMVGQSAVYEASFLFPVPVFTRPSTSQRECLFFIL